MSTQWNQQLSRYVFSKVIEYLEQTFENKSIAKDLSMPNKWTEYEIFEFKYGNAKLKYSPKGSWYKLQNMRNLENISHTVLSTVR